VWSQFVVTNLIKPGKSEFNEGRSQGEAFHGNIQRRGTIFPFKKR
jgi:hypothetical protein